MPLIRWSADDMHIIKLFKVSKRKEDKKIRSIIMLCYPHDEHWSGCYVTATSVNVREVKWKPRSWERKRRKIKITCMMHSNEDEGVESKNQLEAKTLIAHKTKKESSLDFTRKKRWYRMIFIDKMNKTKLVSRHALLKSASCALWNHNMQIRCVHKFLTSSFDSLRPAQKKKPEPICKSVVLRNR